MPNYVLIAAFALAFIVILAFISINMVRWLTARRVDKDLQRSRKILSTEQNDLQQSRRKALIELSQEVEKYGNSELASTIRGIKETEREAFALLKKSLNGHANGNGETKKEQTDSNRATLS
jgi:flagellar biosynthesis/type III secretory pathway M-ring protein FliF/YscJ